MCLTLRGIRGRHQINEILTVAATALAVFVCSPEVVSAKPLSTKVIDAKQKDWIWITEAWTGDNKPYEQREREIDHFMASGEKITSLVAKYGMLAKQRPSDPQAQFSWAYAVYQVAAARQTPYTDGYTMLIEPRKALASVKSPHTFEYARLRFLMEAFGPEWRNQLRPLGRRLLQHRPGDTKVKLILAYLLAGSDNAADQQQALIYAQQLAKIESTKLAVYMIPAGIYMNRWVQYHGHEDAVKARAAYQQWLQYAPPDDAFREDVAVQLRVLQNG